MSEKTNIAIILATAAEASAFFEFDSPELVRKTPFKIFKCNNYILCISGIGKINAAMAVVYLVSQFDISILINLGAAGALKENINFGSVFR